MDESWLDGWGGLILGALTVGLVVKFVDSLIPEPVKRWASDQPAWVKFLGYIGLFATFLGFVWAWDNL